MCHEGEAGIAGDAETSAPKADQRDELDEDFCTARSAVIVLHCCTYCVVHD
jgi:hypothetical protein